MTGWKTKLSAAIAVLYGIAGWFLDLHGADEAMNYVITGISLLGIGHKIEKAGKVWERRNDESLSDLVRRDRDGN